MRWKSFEWNNWLQLLIEFFWGIDLGDGGRKSFCVSSPPKWNHAIESVKRRDFTLKLIKIDSYKWLGVDGSQSKVVYIKLQNQGWSETQWGLLISNICLVLSGADGRSSPGFMHDSKGTIFVPPSPGIMPWSRPF